MNPSFRPKVDELFLENYMPTPEDILQTRVITQRAKETQVLAKDVLYKYVYYNQLNTSWLSLFYNIVGSSMSQVKRLVDQGG